MTSLMSATSVAAYLDIPLGSLYQWNSRGTGPRRLKVGKYVRYRREDVDAWLDAQAAPAPEVTPWKV